MRFFFAFFLLFFSTVALAGPGYRITDSADRTCATCVWPTPEAAVADHVNVTCARGCGATVNSCPNELICRLNSSLGGTFSVNMTANVNIACPAGQERFKGLCVASCPSGQTRDGAGTCSCPAGQEFVNGQCVAPCAANQQRNPDTGQCEGPCTSAQAQAAVAQNADQQDKVTVTNSPISAGLRRVDEKTVVGYTCINTCKLKVTTFLRLGTVTNTSYEMKDWQHWDAPSGGCDVMPASETTITGVDIGYKPDGGCRSGFRFGEVSGVSGCYGAPGSGAGEGNGGGGPQNNPGNPGGSDGAGNNSGGQNQNGEGGACNAGFHDLNGTCVRDSAAGGGGGGGDGQGGVASGGEDCSAPPSCEGDSVSCNALQQAWQQKCQLPEVDRAELRGGILAAGGDPTAGELIQEVDVSEGMQSIFNVTGGSASCPPDIPIVLHFGSFNVSWSPFCVIAVNLRPLVLFLFSFMAFRVFMTPRSY